MCQKCATSQQNEMLRVLVTSIRDGSRVMIEEEQFTLCKSTTVSTGVDGAHSRNASDSVSLSFTCIDFTT